MSYEFKWNRVSRWRTRAVRIVLNTRGVGRLNCNRQLEQEPAVRKQANGKPHIAKSTRLDTKRSRQDVLARCVPALPKARRLLSLKILLLTKRKGIRNTRENYLRTFYVLACRSEIMLLINVVALQSSF